MPQVNNLTVTKLIHPYSLSTVVHRQTNGCITTEMQHQINQSTHSKLLLLSWVICDSHINTHGRTRVAIMGPKTVLLHNLAIGKGWFGGHCVSIRTQDQDNFMSTQNLVAQITRSTHPSPLERPSFWLDFGSCALLWTRKLP